MAGKSSATNWKKCPPGTFANLSEKLQSNRSRRQFLRLAATCAGVGIAGIGGGTAVWMGVTALRGGRLTCDAAQRFAQAYINEQLSQAMHIKVRAHVIDCCRCRPLFESMGANFEL